jgi:hypothetical protein
MNKLLDKISFLRNNETTRLKNENESLLKENKDLTSLLIEAQKINTVITGENSNLNVDLYRELESIVIKIENIHKIEDKTKENRKELSALETRKDIVINKMKDNNILFSLMRAKFLLSYVFKRLTEMNMTNFITELKIEQSAIKPEAWFKTKRR